MFQPIINLEERMKQYNVTGLSVSIIKSGQISHIENYGWLEVGSNKKVDNHTVFHACSISKFLTAMLVLKLTDLDILHLDEDVNQKLHSWKIPDNHLTKHKRVTLRNLLSHQSGIKDPKNSFTELTLGTALPSMVGLLEGTTPYCKAPIEVEYEPETDFHYSDAGFCIIQQLIEDVTGRSFEEVVEDLIFDPLHMTSSFFPTSITGKNVSCGHNPDGGLVAGKYPIYPYPAAAGLWTTASDLSRLICELMDALQHKSKLGLSDSKAKDIISPQYSKSWTGLGVFLDDSEKELEISSLGWGVGFQCMMVGYPSLGNGLIIMTNTDLGVHQLKGIIGEIYHSLKPCLL